MKNSINDEMKKKMSDDDIKSLENITKEGIEWLNTHQNEDKETYDNKMKEYEQKTQPIIMKMYQQNGGMPAQATQAENSKGPKVEDVD